MAIHYGSHITEGSLQNSSDWVLFWTLDSNGSIYSITRIAPFKNFMGCCAYTYSQLTSWKNGGWSQVMFTSTNNPKNRWIFDRSSNPTNLPLILQSFLTGGNPNSYLTINTSYNVTLNTILSSVPNGGSNPYQFMHNNNGSEPGDIPTFGNNGGYVWGTGMYWGNIDAFSNYGGILNTTTAWAGSSGGNTGDRLLIYIR